MRNGFFLAMAGVLFLLGCGEMGNPPVPKASATPKYPYHLELVTQAPRPSAAGVTLPSIGYKANTHELERRAALVVRFEATSGKNNQPVKDKLIMATSNIPEAGGSLTEQYMEQTDQALGKMLADHCVKGTVKVSVALVRSSIRPAADDAEIDSKRLTDWLPAEVTYKNPHPKC